MHATVLLLEEGTALAFVGVVAIVALCLLSLALVGIVFVALHRREPHHAQTAPVPLGVPMQTAMTVHRPRPLNARRGPVTAVKDVEIDVPTRHADAIIQALQASGWFVRDTGEVVATDEDEEALTTISVDVPADAPARVRDASGEEIR